MLTAIAQRCTERGEESELILIGFNLVLAHAWRGDMVAADQAAEATMERALALGGDLPMFVALTVRTVVDAHLGRVEACRRNGEEALVVGRRCDSGRLSAWAVTALGFLELSIGNHEAALRHLDPLVAEWRQLPGATEIVTAPFLPDAVEAMIVAGRFDDAERIVEVLERNGERVGRPWTCAVAARCRSMLQAARGDIESAAVTADLRCASTNGRRCPSNSPAPSCSPATCGTGCGTAPPPPICCRPRCAPSNGSACGSGPNGPGGRWRRWRPCSATT